jgi:ribA/ribD-fused uncharacterized protein
MTEEINRFDGKYGFLSNFYPVRITYHVHALGGPAEGVTVEHLYQANKAKTPAGARAVLATRFASLARAKGHGVATRPDWSDDLKLKIMLDLLRLKFAHPGLRQQLLMTRNAWLVEGNNWNDHFWGVCGGKGQNMLGLLLMKVRHEIRTEK